MSRGAGATRVGGRRAARRGAPPVAAAVAVAVGVVKVGLSLFAEHGPTAVRAVPGTGRDRCSWTSSCTTSRTRWRRRPPRAGALGAAFLTVHASGGEEMLRAALRGAALGAGEGTVPPPRILAVTALTSLSDAEVTGAGLRRRPPRRWRRGWPRSRCARVSGGLVCSARGGSGAAATLRGRLPLHPGHPSGGRGGRRSGPGGDTGCGRRRGRESPRGRPRLARCAGSGRGGSRAAR